MQVNNNKIEMNSKSAKLVTRQVSRHTHKNVTFMQRSII